MYLPTPEDIIRFLHVSLSAMNSNSVAHIAVHTARGSIPSFTKWDVLRYRCSADSGDAGFAWTIF